MHSALSSRAGRMSQRRSSKAGVHLVGKGDAEAQQHQRLGGQLPVRVEVLPQRLRIRPLRHKKARTESVRENAQGAGHRIRTAISVHHAAFSTRGQRTTLLHIGHDQAFDLDSVRVGSIRPCSIAHATHLGAVAVAQQHHERHGGGVLVPLQPDELAGVQDGAHRSQDPAQFCV